MLKRPDSGISTQQYLEQISARFDAAGLYFGHGTDNAWDEACWLLETVLHRNGHTKITAELAVGEHCILEAERLIDLRIETRKPLAYLLGEAWFCGVPFHVNEHVLVPRSPIAELISNDFEPLLHATPGRILDLCTGSGCIGIACAMAFPHTEVVLSDISDTALEVARRNVARHALGERVSVVKSDLFDQLEGEFDLIVTNPPYVGKSEYATLPKEFLQEPSLGLLTEQEGLAIPLRILEQAASYLTGKGLLVLEVGNNWTALAETRYDLPLVWLEFSAGGTGVCAVRRRDLQA